MRQVLTMAIVLAALFAISLRGQASDDAGIAQTPIGSVCVTIKGTCSLTRSIAIGYPCTCEGLGDPGGTPGTVH